MTLTLQTLRTTSERWWLTVAIVFSTFVWLGILSAYALVFLHTPAIPTICYYEDYDYETEEYYFNYNITSSTDTTDTTACLDESTMSSDMVSEAQEKALYEAKSSKLAGIFASFVPLIYIGLFLLFIYVSTAITMAYIRLNALRLSPSQYPEFYKVYMDAAKKLDLQHVPAAYIIDADGAANAFAIKIARTKMVVFFAELVDRLLSEEKMEELQAVAAHELTHVKLGHIYWWFALLPFSMLPFAGKALSRAREYSADRGALFATGNKKATITALLKLVLGARLARIVNQSEYIDASINERGVFATLVRLNATHPSIPERMSALEIYSKTSV